MNIIPELHKKQYETTDFARHINNMDKGLWDYEEYYVDRYLNPCLRTLEIGTGGRIAFALERHKGFTDVTAIDFVQGFISEASRKAAFQKSSIKFLVGNVLDLSFDDETFDQIICFGVVLSHLPNRILRKKALTEAYRVLKPNGIMLIDAHNYLYGVRPKLVAFLMGALRLFSNPYRYEYNDLPRLGIGGKLDLFFFRPNKAQLHYYEPLELAFDILSSGFSILEINFCKCEIGQVLQSCHSYFTEAYLHVAAKKILV